MPAINKVTSVSEFLSNIFSMQQMADTTRCFRGQKSDWDVRPSVLRKTSPDAESKMIAELLLETAPDFSSDQSMFEKLVRAQHYELPTRILDVALNPLAALYFAAQDHAENGVDCDGVVHLFDVFNSRVKGADSDTLSLLCNFSRLTDREKKELADHSKNCRSESEKTAFNNLDACKRLCHFVRMEKPYFENRVNPMDLRKYYLAMPYRTNRRLIAQSGAFMISGVLDYRGMSSGKINRMTALFGHTAKIVVPASSKGDIRSQLDRLNINSKTLFPEIMSAAKDISSRYA